MLFNIVKESILRNKNKKEKGQYIGIPFPFKRISDFYPVIEKGHAIGILAGTGVGKSRFTRFLSIYNTYKFYKETGYKLKIFFFPLEDNKEKVYKSVICHYLHEVHNVRISLQELDSKGDRALPDFVVDHLNEAEKYFEDFEKIVTIIDGYTTPKQIYELLKDYAMKTGKIKKYMVDIEGKQEEQVIYESDVHTLVVIDNMSNVDEDEDHKDERAAKVELVKEYVRKRLCNFFKFSVIIVLQLDFASERQQYTSAGKSVMSKVEPTIAGIGDSKTVARSLHIIFTLFNPSAYEFLRYPQLGEKNADKAYNIEILGNRFRVLRVVKNNEGDVGMRVGLMMDAITENWEELPQPEAPEMQDIYKRVKGNGGEKFIKSKNVIVFEEDYKDPPF